MAGELHCPLCKPGAADRAALDMLIWDLIEGRSLSEEAQSVLEAVWAGRGTAVSTEAIFDEMWRFDPDGGPGPVTTYKVLHRAVAELKDKLSGTGIAILALGHGQGWRLVLSPGGAYVA